MALRTILTFPNPELLKKSTPVETFDDDLKTLAEDMLETMRHAQGIGLAAPQVGVHLRFVVVEIFGEEGEGSDVFMVANPRIAERNGHARIEEGCLSCPELYVEVDRAGEIRLEGQDLDGNDLILELSGLAAICFQHEIDHLDGKLLVHQLSPYKRERYQAQMKQEKGV